MQKPVEPPRIESQGDSASGLLRALSGTAYQGKNLGLAADIWTGMLESKTTIILGLAGALVPAGMREIFAYLIENGLVDCVVSTGANLFHDCHESLGRLQYQGSHLTDDVELQKVGVDRIYDVFASEQEFRDTDDFVARFSLNLPSDRSLTSREFLHELGVCVGGQGGPDGLVVAAARNRVPIYCPAISDSSIGIALGLARMEYGKVVLFDVIKDALELSQIVDSSPPSVLTYLGGGTTKNVIQQATIFMPGQASGHRYAIQITTDSPHWGGLSGCTFEEAQSWGKILPGAEKIGVHCDATIAFPILVSAVAERAKDTLPGRVRPVFDFSGDRVVVK